MAPSSRNNKQRSIRPDHVLMRDTKTKWCNAHENGEARTPLCRVQKGQNGTIMYVSILSQVGNTFKNILYKIYYILYNF